MVTVISVFASVEELSETCDNVVEEVTVFAGKLVTIISKLSTEMACR